MEYKEEQNGEIEALLSIYEGEIEGSICCKYLVA